MKKYLALSSILIPTFPISTIISCSSEPADFKIMSFSIDENKLKSINVNEFNSKPISKEKLLMITKNTSFDRYTLEALGYSANDNYDTQSLNNILFEQISINNNELIIKLKQTYKKGDKIIDNIYRLPNNMLSWNLKF